MWHCGCAHESIKARFVLLVIKLVVLLTYVHVHNTPLLVIPRRVAAGQAVQYTGFHQGRIQRRGHATRPILRIIRLRIELFLELPTKTPTRNL